MTYTITTDLDEAHPSDADTELTSANSALPRIGADCLTDGPVGPGRPGDRSALLRSGRSDAPPGLGRGHRSHRGGADLPGGSAITVEPGGAVELSGPPADGPLQAITAMAADRAVLRAAFAEAGLGLVLLGADPLRPAKRVNPGDRYRAMEQFFVASQTGAAGRGDDDVDGVGAGQSRRRAAGRAGRRGSGSRTRSARRWSRSPPTRRCSAASSPAGAARASGCGASSTRRAAVRSSASNGEDPASDWARYAMKAPVMLVHPTPEMDAVPITDWVPFADWADGRVLLGGRRPTVADLDYHLTTLFPPVRPRRFLEIRYLDSVPDAVWPAVVFTLTTLLDDPAAADIAAEATEPVATAWDRAAQIGLGDRRLHEAATRCVQAAAERAPAELEESMQRLVRSVEQGRCPADDFSDRVVKNGIATAVTELAQGEL